MNSVTVVTNRRVVLLDQLEIQRDTDPVHKHHALIDQLLVGDFGADELV